MNNSIRNIQLVAVVVVLISTIIAFFLEMKEMYDNRDITLADLLLMFIYIEVIGLVRSYWETRAVRITYPLVIAITALARFIILQDKESDPTNLMRRLVKEDLYTFAGKKLFPERKNAVILNKA